ncbi:hypothetical protein GLOIN_2v1522402 [Rhizophagus irregularis DAOM 181602=DAOM 197198]|uniref:Uncharacterized protein n=1 Tax=Rhizophagus irregularis (strain DAOM 181602 / DAOM 197198 / MUCL 43194) TaxID=747089 RepID=A0A2P4QQM7_RHIID|nr:hypothetical protein GLOIN_2v1522402 [Rhizophagus irregularis DAOM 181602=DAOM 197198]POG79944.1 hypothetical protein GLOIN_2v1522402 [Rhizophagus irregularis DAOM 181602=DAOM 197198]|eukprot:XP_025186810.1 hypothetical protein GLOIN_2v1522402 [Rhizophagus irregularis DAOM 181602=DAOM 197198]
MIIIITIQTIFLIITISSNPRPITFHFRNKINLVIHLNLISFLCLIRLVLILVLLSRLLLLCLQLIRIFKISFSKRFLLI